MIIPYNLLLIIVDEVDQIPSGCELLDIGKHTSNFLVNEMVFDNDTYKNNTSAHMAQKWEGEETPNNVCL